MRRVESRYISNYKQKCFFKPMLPREIGKSMCSLLPNQDRFAISVFFDINSEGVIDFGSVRF